MLESDLTLSKLFYSHTLKIFLGNKDLHREPLEKQKQKQNKTVLFKCLFSSQFSIVTL